MRRHLGFTLHELMLTIAVLAIGLAIAVPQMRSVILDNRLVSQINTFNSTLALARSEAVKQNTLTVVCVSEDGDTCTDDANWSDGWMVFVDRNGDLAFDAGGGDGCNEGDTDDCLVAVEAPMTGANTLVGGADVGALIAFSGMGIARCDADADGATEACDLDDAFFTLCDFRGAGHARALTISPTGRTAPSATGPTGDALECPE
ncbi:MAG: GspH/FimT family pseudopilin [Gammaproteobacteria bacterium]